MTSWGETQLAVARDFQEHVVPLVRAPFPPEPRFRGGAVPHPYFGRRHGVPLTYDEYRARIDEGLAVPRSVHGCMHASRTTLYAALLAQLYRRAGIAIDDLHALQMAAAFHDAAREDEGPDHWDDESAALFAEWLASRGDDRETVERWRGWLSQKHAREAAALEQKILHDADVLEVQRARTHFDETQLWLVRDGRGDPALVDETRRLIAITEPDTVKLELEASPDYYVKVMHIVVAVHRESGVFPLMSSLLSEVLDS